MNSARSSLGLFRYDEFNPNNGVGRARKASAGLGYRRLRTAAAAVYLIDTQVFEEGHDNANEIRLILRIDTIADGNVILASIVGLRDLRASGRTSVRPKEFGELSSLAITRHQCRISIVEVIELRIDPYTQAYRERTRRKVVLKTKPNSATAAVFSNGPAIL